jgi:ElaA protein
MDHGYARASARELDSMITWQWCELSELAAPRWYAVMAAREAVFVVEQNCPYQELDGWDLRATHLIAWRGDEVAAYLRSFAPGAKWPEASLGRILTAKAFRASGLGRDLVARGLDHIEAHYPDSAVRIGAQTHLERFYSSFGFVVDSAPYLEDGIPHVEMLRAARQAEPNEA